MSHGVTRRRRRRRAAGLCGVMPRVPRHAAPNSWCPCARTYRKRCRRRVAAAAARAQEYTLVICVTPPGPVPTIGGATRVTFGPDRVVDYAASTTPGRALLFRKDLEHEGLPVTAGTKEIVTLNLWCTRRSSTTVLVVKFPLEDAARARRSAAAADWDGAFSDREIGEDDEGSAAHGGDGGPADTGAAGAADAAGLASSDEETSVETGRGATKTQSAHATVAPSSTCACAASDDDDDEDSDGVSGGGGSEPSDEDDEVIAIAPLYAAATGRHYAINASNITAFPTCVFNGKLNFEAFAGGSGGGGGGGGGAPAERLVTYEIDDECTYEVRRAGAPLRCCTLPLEPSVTVAARRRSSRPSSAC